MTDAEATITVRIDGDAAASDLERLANAIESRIFGIRVEIDTSEVASSVESAVDDAETTVNVEADASEVTSGIDQAVDDASSLVNVDADASQVTTGIDAAIDASSSMVTVQADTSEATARLDSDMAAAGSSSGNSFASAFGAATAAIGGIATAGLVAGLIESEAQSQQTQASIVAMYEAMGREGSEAASVLDQINDQFADSVFGAQTFEDLAQSLAYVGIVGDDVVGVMSALEAEVQLAGTGADGIDRAAAALQRMESEGRVTNDTLNQLSGAGVFIFERLAADMGIAGDDYAATLRDMAAAGEISMADITSALESEGGQWSEAARNAAEGMEDGFLTQLASLQNTLQSAFTDALDLSILADLFGDLSEVLEPLVAVLGETFMSALSALVPAIAPLLAIVGDLLVAFAPIIEVVAELAGTLLEALTPALQAIAEFMAPLIEIVADLFEWIGEKLGPVIERLAENVIMPLVEGAIEFLISAFENTMEAIDGLMIGIETIGGWFSWLWEQVVELAIGMAETWNNITESITGAFETIGGWITDAIGWFAELPGRILGFLGDLGGRIWSSIDLPGLAANILGTINDVQNWFSELPGRILDGLGDLGSSIWDGISSGFDTLMGHIEGIIDDIIQFFRDLPGRVTDAIGDLGSSIWDSINPFSSESGGASAAVAASAAMGNSAQTEAMNNATSANTFGNGVMSTHDARSYHQPINVNVRSSAASPELIARQLERRIRHASGGSILAGAL